MGLYITTADASANLVEFCPAEPFATLSPSFGDIVIPETAGTAQLLC